MAKQKWIEVCFVELREDLILLEIANFHKYIGSLTNEITKCTQIRTRERQKRACKRGVDQDTNLRHQAIICLLEPLWTCRLPVKAKKDLSICHVYKVGFQCFFHQYVSCFSNYFWACGLPVQAKRSKRQRLSQSGSPKCLPLKSSHHL